MKIRTAFGIIEARVWRSRQFIFGVDHAHASPPENLIAVPAGCQTAREVLVYDDIARYYTRIPPESSRVAERALRAAGAEK